ncbi:MAG: O-antigen ligase family protein [Bacteroidota bacterium]
MLKYFSHNAPVFLLLSLLIVLGNIHPVLGSIALILVMAFWALKEKNQWLILVFSFTLILGDSRVEYLLPFKGMRYAAISLLFIKVIWDFMRNKYKPNPLILPSIPFFFIAFLGVGFSPTPATSLFKALSYLFLIVICLSYLPYYFKKKNYRLVDDFLYTAIFVFLMGFVYMIDYDWAYINHRYRGFLGNPNGLGTFSAIMIPFGLMVYHRFPKKKRAALFLVIIGIISVILTESRTALGAIFLFFFLFFVYQGGKGRIRAFWFFGFPLALFIFFSVPLETILGIFGLDEFLRVESLKTGTGRFLAWAIGLTEIQNNLWIGRGFGYEEFFFYERRAILILTEHQGGMHNSYLTFLMNNGILGVIPFVIFLLRLFSSVKIKKLGIPFIIIMLISANFESWLNSSLNSFTFFFFMVTSFLIYYKNLTYDR